jgi:hypothetical protein
MTKKEGRKFYCIYFKAFSFHFMLSEKCSCFVRLRELFIAHLPIISTPWNIEQIFVLQRNSSSYILLRVSWCLFHNNPRLHFRNSKMIKEREVKSMNELRENLNVSAVAWSQHESFYWSCRAPNCVLFDSLLSFKFSP